MTHQKMKMETRLGCLHNQAMRPTKKQKLQGGLGAHLSRSCDLLKKGILMAYVSNHRKWFGIGFPKKENLMDYISRLCNLLKNENTGW